MIFLAVSYRTYHRFSFRVNDGYFVVDRASAGGKYFGNTSAVKMSGRIMTKDLPCGNHDTTSLSEASQRICISLSGKISRFFSFAAPFSECRYSSSSLTISATGWGPCDSSTRGTSTSSVKAVAASTKWDSPLLSPLKLAFSTEEVITLVLNCVCFEQTADIFLSFPLKSREFRSHWMTDKNTRVRSSLLYHVL